MPIVALVQQHATPGKASNVARASLGTDEILHADLDFTKNQESHARQLFLRDRRPELYGAWLARYERGRTVYS